MIDFPDTPWGHAQRAKLKITEDAPKPAAKKKATKKKAKKKVTKKG